MAKNDQEQIQSILQSSKHILIALKKNPSGDALCASLALALFCKKLGKHVDIVSENFDLPKRFTFLPSTELVKPKMPYLQKFVIKVDVKELGLQELSYDVKENNLFIYVTPQHGQLTHENIRTAQTDFRYDLLITLGTSDVASLGKISENNSELFYKVPILNIDASTGNEHYGAIDCIDFTASSTSEIVASILENMNESLLTKEIATSLLAGMISATQSFKTKNVKPQALTLASKLVGIGADREFIIQNLYRTKTLSTLKLWGQALSNLQFFSSLGLVSTSLTRENFVRSDATETDLYDIIDELIFNSPEAKIAMIIHENIHEAESVQVIVHTNNEYNAKELTKSFDPDGDKKQVSFSLQKKSLKDAEDMVREEIQKNISS